MNAVEVSATNLNEIKVEKMWNWVLLRNSWCYRNLRMRIFGCSFVRQPKSKRERVYSSIKYMHLLCFFVGCSELCQRNITFYDHSYAIRTWAMCVCCVFAFSFRLVPSFLFGVHHSSGNTRAKRKNVNNAIQSVSKWEGEWKRWRIKQQHLRYQLRKGRPKKMDHQTLKWKNRSQAKNISEKSKKT